MFALLPYGHPTDTGWRLAQRNLETLVGIALALLFGLALPILRQPLRRVPSPA